MFIMNEKLGFYSAILAALTTSIFAISMLFKNDLLAFGISIGISWSYLALTCAFSASTRPERKTFSYAGIAFASVYAAYINLVYDTQLTTVNQQAASVDILQILKYEPGSWTCNVDLLGYAMMAISTLFVGLTIIPDNASNF